MTETSKKWIVRDHTGDQHRQASEDWSCWIMGEEILGRQVIAANYWCLADLLAFLYEDTPYKRGVMCATRPAAVSRLGRFSRIVDVEELLIKARVSPGFYLVPRDLVFVPCQKGRGVCTSSIEKIYKWAVKRGLPYVGQHDNDHVWFSAFPPELEKWIFLRWLTLSIFRTSPLGWCLDEDDWQVIRDGISVHGWTLNRRLCSYVDGVFTYTLWGGVPRATSFERCDEQDLSEINKSLTLRVARNGQVSVRQTQACCPLKNEYGSLQETAWGRDAAGATFKALVLPNA